MEKKLPKNWVFCPLDDLAKIQSGGTPARSNSSYWNGDIPWVKISDIKGLSVDRATEYITEKGLKNSSATLFPKGTILFTIFATIGRIGVLEIEATTNQAIAGITPSELINKKYITYSLLELSSSILSEGKGVAQKNINQTILKNTLIPLPPLPEQTRIVAKLDQLFGQLEQINESLDKIPRLLKDFRQQVLNKGFQTHHDRVALEKICIKIQDGAHHSPKNLYPINDKGLFPYVTSKNIRNNFMKLDTLTYVDKEFHDTIYPRCRPEFGDVLLTKDGASTGNVALNEFDEPISLLSSVCLIKTDKKKLLPSYLKYFIQSPTGFSELIGQMTGTAIKRIVLKKIKKATIPLPSIQEQKKIVTRVEMLFAKADTIEQQYQTLKQKIVTLPQSILHKAFKGELVPQLESDGDARELLETINGLKKENGKVKEKKPKAYKVEGVELGRVTEK